jgi:single-stranded-DNA-specific exonuclease
MQASDPPETGGTAKLTIVLTIQDDHAYGSGRSIANLNLVEVLTKSAPLLERYGGHPMAVGIGLKTENIAAFYEEMDREIKAQIDPSELESFISYDGEAQLGEMTPEFFAYLEKLSPFGHSNQKPVYRFNDMKVVRCNPIGGGAHTRGIMINRTGQIEFIAFNRPVSEFYGRSLDVLATPQLNRRSPDAPPQLNIIDIREVY